MPPESLLRPSPLGVTTQAFVNGMIGTVDFVNGDHMDDGQRLCEKLTLVVEEVVDFGIFAELT